MKKYLKQYYENNGQNGDRVALLMYFRIFKRYLKKGNKVLEFGAGNGFLSKRLATIFVSEAIELSSYARKNILKNSPNTLLVESEKELRVNCYDGIICLHTLEHITNPEKIIKYFNNSLKQNGIFLMVVPNIDGFGHKLKQDKWFGFRDKTHVSLLPTIEWKKMLNNNNFKIIETGSDWFWNVPYLPFVPNIIQKIFIYPGCLLMVLLGRIIYPESWGEDLIIIARKN